MCPFCVSIDSGKVPVYSFGSEIPGHVLHSFHFWLPWSTNPLVGKPAAAWRYRMVCGIDGKVIHIRRHLLPSCDTPAWTGLVCFPHVTIAIIRLHPATLRELAYATDLQSKCILSYAQWRLLLVDGILWCSRHQQIYRHWSMSLAATLVGHLPFLLQSDSDSKGRIAVCVAVFCCSIRQMQQPCWMVQWWVDFLPASDKAWCRTRVHHHGRCLPLGTVLCFPMRWYIHALILWIGDRAAHLQR